MNIKDNIKFFKEQGFNIAGKTDNGILLKSDNGIAIAYNDGHYEGFIKPSDSVNELGTKDILEALILVGLSTVFFTTDLTIVDGQSMSPTYKNYQIIIKTKSETTVNRMLLAKNAIVKFKTPEGDTAIKRIAGVPGDKIEFEGTIIKINGKVVDTFNREYHSQPKAPNQSYDDYAKYLKEKTSYELKNNEFFVMGDNRDVSTDSRKYGPVQASAILAIIEK